MDADTYYFTPGGFLYRKDPGPEEAGAFSAATSPTRFGTTEQTTVKLSPTILQDRGLAPEAPALLCPKPMGDLCLLTWPWLCSSARSTSSSVIPQLVSDCRCISRMWSSARLKAKRMFRS